jgi:serine/threonine protein kinase
MIPSVGQSVGNAILEYKLGEGSAVNIWAARHAELHREVAVKFLSAGQTTPDAALRFERDGCAMARIKSPYVPEVFGAGRSPDGTPFIVMELLAGRRLDAWAAEHGRLSVEQVARVLDHVGAALAAAHALGIVHRRVKPESILVSGEPHDLHAKLVDFDSAESKSRSLTSGSSSSHGGIPDTRDHRSYEWLVDNQHSDRRSLAIVAYWCLTGRHPFESDVLESCTLGEERHFIPISDVRPDMPIDIDAWFDRGLSRDTDGGFSSTADMSKMFRVFAQDSAAHASEVSCPRPTLDGAFQTIAPAVQVPSTRKNNARPIGGAALALLGVVGIALASRHGTVDRTNQVAVPFASGEASPRSISLGAPGPSTQVASAPSGSASTSVPRPRSPASARSVPAASTTSRARVHLARSPIAGVVADPAAWSPTDELGEPGERPAPN